MLLQRTKRQHTLRRIAECQLTLSQLTTTLRKARDELATMGEITLVRSWGVKVEEAIRNAKKEMDGVCNSTAVAVLPLEILEANKKRLEGVVNEMMDMLALLRTDMMDAVAN